MKELEVKLVYAPIILLKNCFIGALSRKEAIENAQITDIKSLFRPVLFLPQVLEYGYDEKYLLRLLGKVKRIGKYIKGHHAGDSTQK